LSIAAEPMSALHRHERTKYRPWHSRDPQATPHWGFFGHAVHVDARRVIDALTVAWEIK